MPRWFFDGADVVAHAGFQTRVITVGDSTVAVGGTGGVLVREQCRGRGYARLDHGYAAEAAQQVMQNAFDYGLNRVIAVVHAENSASGRVCLRLGMTDEGPTNRYYDAEYELFRAAPASA